MARQKVSQPEENATGPGPWVASFNDCMTNMLCFFVLLVSFSSFDEAARSRVAGAFQTMSYLSIFPQMQSVNSIIDQRDNIVDFTEQGSEKFVDHEPEVTHNPHARPTVPHTDAYRDRKVFYLASRELFWAQGSTLTPQGRRTLARVGEYMKRLPCQVIVREVSGGESSRVPLERAWAVVECFTQMGIDEKWFGLGSPTEGSTARFSEQSVIEITLMAKSIYK